MAGAMPERLSFRRVVLAVSGKKVLTMSGFVGFWKAVGL